VNMVNFIDDVIGEVEELVVEKLHLRKMFDTYRPAKTVAVPAKAPVKTPATVTSTKSENVKKQDHDRQKGQPILPEVGQVILDQRANKKYSRGRLLGKGGFARCYEVTDMNSEKKYACKAIAKARIAKPHQQQKIANEVELHKNLNGNYIVGFQDYFEDSENVYMLLELCSKKSMVQVMKQRRTLTEPETRYFIHQAIQGVHYLHKEKIIHRDIKLGNLFINNNMDIRIGDFGLAVRIAPDGRKETSVCGTPNYIAPEVLNKTGHSIEVDTWALGCVMYTLLVGRPPFETSCLKDTYMRIRNNEYAIPSRVSRSAAKLIQKFLSERPEDRPQLDAVIGDEFFTRGFFPKTLPTICCVAPPKFNSIENRNSPMHKKRCSSVTRTASNSSCNSSCTSGDERNSVSSMRDAFEIISLKDSNIKDELGESGIESNGDEEESETNSLDEAANDSSMDYNNPKTLCNRLSACLSNMPGPHSFEPSLGDTSDSDSSSGCDMSADQASRLWISKWVDYSNKYGFGAQLSNGCIVIRYNDSTTLAVDAQKRRLSYFDEDRNIFRFSVNNIPEDLSRKVTLLNYFSNYMDKHLLKGGDLERSNLTHESFSEIAIIDIWFRTDKAMVMYLSDGTLQVNFLSDHTKIILNPDETDDTITFINQNRESFVTNLATVAKKGCRDAINERLQYCLMVLHKLNEMYVEDGS